MVRVVNVREFKARLSRYLAEVAAGDEVAVTSHRRVVARVVAPVPAGAGVPSPMVASGEARWNGGKPQFLPVELGDHVPLLSDIVLDQRG